MTYLPPDPPLDVVAPKASAASALRGPRAPVTRWNRRYLLAGGAVLASIIGLGFYIGFSGSHRPPPKSAPPPPSEATPAAPAFADRYPHGYSDPAVQAASAPGVATLPPPGAVSASTSTAAPAAPPPLDPAVQQARAQAQAARAAPPFFQTATATDAAAATAAPAVPIALGAPAASPPQSAAASAPAPDVQPANGQGAKQRFSESARAEDYLANPLRPPESPFEVKAGTVIPAALLTAINSDLPGEIIAQVTAPVYDTATGRTVLIAQGSRLIGQYDSQVVYGQERALIAWNRIVMPDGRSINIGAMEGADLTGASGLSDRVDSHFGQLARGILLSTIFSVGAASAQDASARSSGGFILNSAGSGVSGEATQVGSELTSRDLNRQPTLRVRAGWPLRVLVNKDMILAPYT